MTDQTNKVIQQKTIPEDLQASEIRYRRLFESARDGILILDAASRRITDVNPFMVEFLGYSRAEFLGKELWEIGLFKDKDESQNAFGELQAAGYIRYEDMPLETKAGKLWNVEFISNVYRENAHHVVQCNIRDITERKRAEEMRLWHSTIVESSNDGIVSFSFDGTVISWNRGAERIFGYTAEEAIGQPISLLAPLAGQLEQQDEILKKIERGGSVVGFETLCVRKDGGLINISLTVSQIQDDNGRTLGVAAIVLDITERKRTEERLKQSEQWLRTIFETSHEGILVEDHERIHYVNKSYARMFGHDNPEELIGQHISVVVSPEDRERLLEFGTSRLRGEQPPSEYEFKGKRKDGSLVDVEASVAASQVGHSNYITTMLRDITERKQAEEALMKLNEKLEQRVAERTVELMEMNASLQAEIVERRRAEHERASIMRRLVMAQEEERRRIARDLHDQFGQALTVLLLKLGMLKEDCGEQENLSEQVVNLEKIATQLDADVDFLVWEIRPTVLDDLGLQDALTNFAQNWSKHFRIPVEVLTHGLGKEASTSEIDTILYRIAQEALNNVAKHARATSVTVLLEGRGDAVSLIIEDDGTGFDAESMSGANNKGLGLIGMRERAALVGGTAEIESHPEEGTRVIVRIPMPHASAERSGA